jgi:hypothetical protein
MKPVVDRLLLMACGMDPLLFQINKCRLQHFIGMDDPTERGRLRPQTCWQPGKVACVIDSINRTEGLKGDVVELGVFKGGGTILIAEHLARNGSTRRVWGFDTFEGFPTITEQDRMHDGRMHATKELFADTSFRRVEATVKLFELTDYVEIRKGPFEHILPQVFKDPEREFSLVIIDCDLYSGSKFCIEFFYDRIPSGGIVIIDDYGIPGRFDRSTYPGVNRAVDRIMANKPETLQHGADSMWFFVKS